MFLLTAIASIAAIQGAFAQYIGSGCNGCHQIGTGVVPGGCGNCHVSGGGGWSQWSEWAGCVAVFGLQSQTRYRTCIMTTCQGTSSEARPCTPNVQPTPAPAPPPPPAPPAQWTEWGPWGACSASCGGGIASRTRICNHGCTVNCHCPGPAVDTMPCNTQPCCEYSEWSTWSPCSVTCGMNGVTYRTRTCSCAQGCEALGPATEQSVCNAEVPCPTVYEPPPPPAPPVTSAPTTCVTCYIPVPSCITCVYYGTCCGYGRRKRQTDLLLE
uniref:Coadhesin-like n=1 Tax=Haemonchus contortus TaxID=6289 RepID=A0A7I5E5E1_HAECO